MAGHRGGRPPQRWRWSVGNMLRLHEALLRRRRGLILLTQMSSGIHSHSLWALQRGSPRCTPGDAGVDRGPTARVCRTTQFKQILMVFPIKILIWKIYSFSDTQRFSGFLQIFHQMAISRKQIVFHFHRPIRCIPCLLQLLIILPKTPTKKCNHHPSSWWFYNSNFTMDYGTYTIVYL